MRLPVGTILLIFLLGFVNGCRAGCAVCDPTQTICYLCLNSFNQKLSDGTCGYVQTSISYCDVYNAVDFSCSKCLITYNVTNQVCIPDVSGCLRYSLSGNCQECGFGTSMLNGRCTGVLNCREYLSLGANQYTCNICHEGFNSSFGASC